MAGCVIRAGNRHYFHKTHITRQMLEQIARNLGISQTVCSEISSTGEWIHIYVGEPPATGTTVGTGATPAQPGGGRP
ncbi:MAG: hypothetical protein JO166_02455 [Deltaproteobacteria bacterium]|nr:hypothetical protein [Deltaproteobacteria bacterium]